MKKLLFSSLFLIGTAFGLQAQTGGPDTFGYTWADQNAVGGPVFNWVDITTLPGATQVSGLLDDNVVGPFVIGFPFRYYWYDVSQFWIGSNGYIKFNGLNMMAHPFPSFPTAAAPNDVIAPFASDLTFGEPGNIGTCWYYTSPGADSLVVSWLDAPFYTNVGAGYTGSNSFQIILAKADSSLKFQYLQQQGASVSTASFISIGMENNTGNIGLQYSTLVYPPANTVVGFTYPPVVTFQVNDASVQSNDNPTTGGKFLSKGGNSFQMSTEISNTGNQPLNPFNVWMRVLNASNFVQAQDNIMTAPMAPSTSQILVGPTVFNPTTAGVYRFFTDTQLAGDATPSNNRKIMELQVVDTTLSNIRLSYDDGIADGTGISWTGGNGGTGVKFTPPFYPCDLTQLDYFIMTNPTNSGFHAKVYDDSGVNGAPGALIDSITVASTSVLLNAWNAVTLPTPIVITSGSVYIGWVMDGEGIVLGEDTNLPISNNTYEILSNSWAPYRYREIRDLMINATIKRQSGVAVQENNIAKGEFGMFYPNPANNLINLDFNLDTPSKMALKIFNINGQLIMDQNYGFVSQGANSMQLDLRSLPAGVYSAVITVGNNDVRRKMVVTK